ncbi:MAG: hypothetical protein PHW83_03880 [Bacteroidales bacterium]|nr:hypothetical protein [Bacteroidales bacterium]
MRKKSLKRVGNSTISSLFAGIVVIMAMFMTVACEKDETSVADQQQSVRKPQPISDMEIMQYLPEVVNGRLVFKDEDSFKKVRNWIGYNQSNPEKIKTIMSFQGFHSMRSIYDIGMQIINTDNEVKDVMLCNLDEFNSYINNYKQVFYPTEYDNSTIYEIQTTNLMSYIANEYGIYQVGKIIFRTSYITEYQIIDGDESKIPIIINDYGTLNSSENIIINNFINLNQKDLNHTYEVPDIPNPTKQRILIRFYSALNGGQWEYELRITGQKKTLGIWWNNLSRMCDCRMSKTSSSWRINGINYDWHDAVYWSYVQGWGADFQFTVILTPSSTPITFSLSLMPYVVQCQLVANGDYYYWTDDNVFGTGHGWN